MDAEDVLFRKRLEEFAQKSYQNNQYFFTGFLTMAQTDLYYRMERELSYVPVTLFGGTADCERVMLRFGSEELCGYEEPFPISCIEIAPAMEKFAQQLSHRDYLGALMNLGIERSTLGDIIQQDKTAFLFCTEKMAPYLLENLTQIHHTNVRCRIAPQIPASAVTNLVRKSVLVSAPRADAVIAKLYNLSRSQCSELFRGGKIFVNGRLCENSSYQLKQGERISVRGYGKFLYQGIEHETKKGKQSIAVDSYA